MAIQPNTSWVPHQYILGKVELVLQHGPGDTLGVDIERVILTS